MRANAASLAERCADVAGEAEVRDAVTVQVTDLFALDAEAPLAPLAVAGLDARPRCDCRGDLLAESHLRKVEVQVNLKSSADDHRGIPQEWRRLLRPALLRGARADPFGACGLRPSPLSATGAQADRVHRLRAANRIDVGRDRPRAGQAATGPRADARGMGTAFLDVDDPNRRPHSRARAPEAGTDRVHRLRLPVARPLQAGEPGRPGGEARPGPALLDRLAQAGGPPCLPAGGEELHADGASVAEGPDLEQLALEWDAACGAGRALPQAREDAVARRLHRLEHLDLVAGPGSEPVLQRGGCGVRTLHHAAIGCLFWLEPIDVRIEEQLRFPDPSIDEQLEYPPYEGEIATCRRLRPRAAVPDLRARRRRPGRRCRHRTRSRPDRRCP